MIQIWTILWALSIVPCFIYLVNRTRDLYGWISPRDSILVLLLLLCSIPVVNVVVVVVAWLVSADSNLDREP